MAKDPEKVLDFGRRVVKITAIDWMSTDETFQYDPGKLIPLDAEVYGQVIEETDEYITIGQIFFFDRVRATITIPKGCIKEIVEYTEDKYTEDWYTEKLIKKTREQEAIILTQEETPTIKNENEFLNAQIEELKNNKPSEEKIIKTKKDLDQKRWQKN